MKILGYIGLAITGISGILILVVLAGLVDSPPIEALMASFIIGQSFFNGYIIGRLK